MMTPATVTFDQLVAMLDDPAGATTPYSTQSNANACSALRAFARERSLTLSEPIGSSLRASYHRNLRQHLEELRSEGRPSKYIANRKSLLRRCRSTLLGFDRRNAAETEKATPLQAALAQIFDAGVTQRGLAKSAGVPLATLKRWLNGTQPQQRGARYLRRIEIHLGMAPGSLTDLLPTFPPRCSVAGTGPVEVRIAYRQRLAVASTETYALKRPTPELRREWLVLLRYKTALSACDMERQPSGRWSKTSAPVREPRANLWHAFQGKDYVASADIAWQHIAQYLGWLSLPATSGGGGIEPDDANCLAWLCDARSLNRYLEWRLERCDGVVHGGFVFVLKLVASLCHPNTGFLTQSPEIGQRYGITDGNEWRARCAEAFKFAKERQRSAQEEAEPSRDPFEPLRFTLGLANPLEAVADMIVRMTADRPTTSGHREAIWLRDRTLVKLLASNPLRAKNLRMLTYRSDNTGQLRQDPDGGWRIQIPRKMFKNAKGAARDRDYDMRVNESVWSDIEKYIKHYRPILAGGAEGYLFVSGKRGEHTRPWAGLNRRVEALTKRYLAHCPGVGPHGFRHIVTTAILKRSPNDWQTAALILHDKEETVKRTYAHLRCDDGARRMGEILGATFSRMA